MSKVSWYPRATIPRKQKTAWQKRHTVITVFIFWFCVIYIWLIWGSYVREKDIRDVSPNDAIAILVDTSLSMSSNDIKPNRYEHALNIAWWLLSSFNATYVTIPYAGIPILQTPISTDTFGIKQVLSQFSLWSYHVWREYLWSAPGNAIWLAANLLSQIPAEKKTILLLGDSNTNTGFSIDTFIPVLQQEKIGLIICTIWEVWYPIGIDHIGSVISSDRDIKRLDYITSEADWKRWICNDIPESIERITTYLKDNTSFKSSQNFSVAERLWKNDILQVIAILGIVYTILVNAISLIHYWTKNRKDT